ncbi:MAG: hypothetical protein UV80_C0001G0018 [Candidatus Peregrinibacteria bacterium GW2011_GWF2_43_17]|nr:MAG: hypothetical protein UV80_C0001G0018 [Candidatus Peregrinibacteria bacterium GW2011_GWF2_43_17]KKT20385.1 MAG: hypothetical protein UW03_C0005G0020 [Candidatus Peregrinibacteria bacterium GW2011_GWA2_43_8]HAU40261.1 hypothetical protein [Candidatus Peregrinibacteria bacterium]
MSESGRIERDVEGICDRLTYMVSEYLLEEDEPRGIIRAGGIEPSFEPMGQSRLLVRNDPAVMVALESRGQVEEWLRHECENLSVANEDNSHTVRSPRLDDPMSVRDTDGLVGRVLELKRMGVEEIDLRRGDRYRLMRKEPKSPVRMACDYIRDAGIFKIKGPISPADNAEEFNAADYGFQIDGTLFDDLHEDFFEIGLPRNLTLLMLMQNPGSTIETLVEQGRALKVTVPLGIKSPDDAFQEASRIYPVIKGLLARREGRQTVSVLMRGVSKDGRAQPFSSYFQILEASPGKSSNGIVRVVRGGWNGVMPTMMVQSAFGGPVLLPLVDRGNLPEDGIRMTAYKSVYAYEQDGVGAEMFLFCDELI